MEFWLFWKFFPMNVAAFIVTVTNIHQIMECSSPESATLDFFCFFALDHLHTLFTNDLDSTDNSNSVVSLFMMKFWEYATSWELILSGCPDLSRSVSVSYGLRASVEKNFFVIRSNLLYHSPRSFIRLSWSIIFHQLISMDLDFRNISPTDSLKFKTTRTMITS